MKYLIFVFIITMLIYILYNPIGLGLTAKQINTRLNVNKQSNTNTNTQSQSHAPAQETDWPSLYNKYYGLAKDDLYSAFKQSKVKQEINREISSVTSDFDVITNTLQRLISKFNIFNIFSSSHI